MKILTNLHVTVTLLRIIPRVMAALYVTVRVRVTGIYSVRIAKNCLYNNLST